MQHHITWQVIVLFLLTLIASCTVPAQPRTMPEHVNETEVEQFFQYFARVKELSREALQHEYAQQESAFARSRSAADRLRLALLLSLPGTHFENTTYALALLQEYLHEPTPNHAQLREVAAFLLTFIPNTRTHEVSTAPLITPLQEVLQDQERQLLAQKQINKKLQSELEAQKSLAHTLNRQLQEALSDKERQLLAQQQLSKKLQDERRNVRRLQEKIEKIKDIEKSLIEKEHTNDKGT